MNYSEKLQIAMSLVKSTGKIDIGEIKSFISMLEEWKNENPASPKEIPDE